MKPIEQNLSAMKVTLSLTGRMSFGLCVAGLALLARPAAGEAVVTSPRAIIIAANQTEKKVEPTAPVAPSLPKRTLKIESVERVSAEESRKEITWLGIYTEETTEALGAQLELKSGEGLLITFVAPESPAAKAGLQKYDVLVELDDQLLVHPAQLAKLIRSHKEGDAIRLTFYRQGKKQTTPAKLGKRTEEIGWVPAMAPMPASITWQASAMGSLNEQTKSLHDSLIHLDADRQRVKVEVERSIEEACKTLAESLQGKGQAIALGTDAKDWEDLAHAGINIGNDATVVVKKDGSSVKTIVKTDETGVYILLASPKKRLTIYDKEGKLLFNGEIETEAQQQKVPAELWKKVDPMLQQLAPATGGKVKPSAQYLIELKT